MNEVLKVGDRVLCTTIHREYFSTKVERVTPTQAILTLKAGLFTKRDIRIPIEGGRELTNRRNKHSRHMYTFEKYSNEKYIEIINAGYTEKFAEVL